MTTQLVILAAGIGRRFGGLKQLTPVGPSGEAIMDYTVHDARQAGFDEVILVIRRETEAAVRAHVDDGFGRHVPVHYVFQEIDAVPAEARRGRTRPWGTVQAVLSAAPAVHGPFGVANADDFYGRPAISALGGFLARPVTAPPTWAMVGFALADTLPVEGTVSRGLVHATDGFLQTIDEVHGVHRHADGAAWISPDGRRTIPGDSLVSMNLWGFGPEVLGHLEQRFAAFLAGDPGLDDECYLPIEVGAAVGGGIARVAVLPAASRWCGMTSTADMATVCKTISDLVKAGAYPDQLWPG